MPDFSASDPQADWFDGMAKACAEEFENGNGRDNSVTQIRRFYDELTRWQARVNGSNCEFNKYEPFIRMMNAKVAYALNRRLVNESFERWMNDCIKNTTSAKALTYFHLHFEAMLGFLKHHKK